jgi:3-phosphoshikimate 1-carboxyvinyltransferase
MAARFTFDGTIPPSKSLLIRHLLLSLYADEVPVPLLSRCSDVVAMERAVAAFRQGAPVIDCGEAGLVLRLCLGCAARRGGDFLLVGSPRLIARPHGTLLSALGALGASVERAPDGRGLRVRSSGWRRPAAPLELLGGLSSQFASSLILNAWELPFALQLVCDAEPVSEGYLEMSLQVARRFGMDVRRKEEPTRLILQIASGQRLRAGDLTSEAEADVSSAFAVAALAAVAGHAFIRNFPKSSAQPDHRFVPILRQMGVPIELGADGLRVERAERLLPVEVNLGGAPDLAPVLAVLCAFADGRSLLYGAPQLRGKESDRVATTAALLSQLGRRNVPRDDGLEIFGAPISARSAGPAQSFDATGDHRLVMAGAVARWAGVPLLLRGLDSVEKSFPEFLDIAGLKPARSEPPMRGEEPLP